MKPCATWKVCWIPPSYWFLYALPKTGYIDCICQNQQPLSGRWTTRKKNCSSKWESFPQMNFWVGKSWPWPGTAKRVLTKLHWIFYPETRKYASNACSHQYQVFQVFLYPGTIHDQTNCSIPPFDQLRRHFEYIFEAQMCIHMHIKYRSSLQTMASFSTHSDLRLEGWSYVGRIRWSWISPDVSPAHLQKGHHVGDTCLSRPSQLGQFPCSQQNQRYNLGNWKISEMIRVGRFWVFFSWKFRIFIYILENMEPQNDDVVPKKSSSKGFMFKFEVKLMFFVAWKRSHEVFWICF